MCEKQASTFLNIDDPKHPVVGGNVSVNNDNFRAGLSADHTLHGASNVTANAGASMASGPHSVHADAFHTKTFVPHVPTINTSGATLKYNHEAGHGVGLGVTRQDRHTTYSANATANLYQTPSGNGSVNLTGGAGKTVGPYSSGKVNSFGMLHAGFKF